MNPHIQLNVPRSRETSCWSPVSLQPVNQPKLNQSPFRQGRALENALGIED
jgi:hypothetical protein